MKDNAKQKCGGAKRSQIEKTVQCLNVFKTKREQDYGTKKLCKPESDYLDEVYLVTALVPSETACLASSPGRMRRTAVWISRDEMVDFLL